MATDDSTAVDVARFAGRPENPAIDVIGEVVVERRVNRLLDAGFVIRVQG